jgi:hypothetical protein
MMSRAEASVDNDVFSIRLDFDNQSLTENTDGDEFAVTPIAGT